MGKSYREELVGVFGYPVDENPTVVIAQAAFLELGVPFRYITMEVKPEGLQDAIKGLRAMNMKGINLTIPHKVEVIKYLDELTPAATLIGAVNTVYVRDGRLHGENTDGKGFIDSLEQEGVQIAGKKVVVLGAGGAARAITVELALKAAKEITIVNRSSERAQALVSVLNEKTSTHAQYTKWDHAIAIAEDVDIVVNATSLGLFPHTEEKPNVDFDSILPHMVVCDVIPNHPRTMFLKEAEKRGAKTIDGLGMLVNQAILGIQLWTGLVASSAVMVAALRSEFGIE